MRSSSGRAPASSPPRRENAIEVNLQDLDQFFNTIDPSPFHEKDLDNDLEEFIVSWAKEYPLDEPVKLVVHLQNPILEDLLTLPGVGHKTANILLGNAFGQPTIGVDTHVARLSQRLGLTDHDDPEQIEADLLKIVAPKDRVRFCHLLQYHGRRVCIGRAPRCPQCVVNDLCPYPRKINY